MIRSALFPGILLLGALILAGGCTTASPPQPATPVATPDAATPDETDTPASAITIAKPPTTYPENIPAMYEVSVQVDRNVIATDPYILATFRGGKGTNVVQKVEMTVARSDGRVENGTMTRPRIGDTIRLNGTTGTDFVTVDVFLGTGPSGKIYRVLNENLTFRSH